MGIATPGGAGGTPADGGGWKPNRDDLRRDGTKKGNGWLGVLPITDSAGRTGSATEYSVGISIDGKEVDIPSLVPTLSEEEIKLMVEDIIPGHKKVPKTIMKKAIDHAKDLIGKGKSPFKEEGMTIKFDAQGNRLP